MIQLSRFFYLISSGRVTLAALLVFLTFTATVLPAQARKAEVYSHGVGSPDTSIIYTADELYTMAEGYGADGRAAYIRARFTFDVIFPIVYLFFLGTSISWCLASILSPGSRLRLLNLFPFFGWLFDMLENVSAALVFARFPQTTPIVDSLSGVFTAVKWVFVYGSMIGVLPLFVLAIWVLLRKNRVGRV